MTAKKTAKKIEPAPTAAESSPPVAKPAAAETAEEPTFDPPKYAAPHRATVPAEAQKAKVQATRLARLARKVPAVGKLVAENAALRAEVAELQARIDASGQPSAGGE